MTINDWIRGKVGFTMTELNIQAILVDRAVASETEADSVDVRARELCWADALILYLSKDSKKEQDGGTSQSESVSGYSKDETKEFAMYLYGKWGEEIPGGVINEVTDATDRW